MWPAIHKYLDSLQKTPVNSKFPKIKKKNKTKQNKLLQKHPRNVPLVIKRTKDRRDWIVSPKGDVGAGLFLVEFTGVFWSESKFVDCWPHVIVMHSFV